MLGSGLIVILKIRIMKVYQRPTHGFDDFCQFNHVYESVKLDIPYYL